MVSVASGGKADRIAARSLFKVLRAGSGMPARYSSTFFGAALPFAAELRLPDFAFCTPAMLQELPLSSPCPRPAGGRTWNHEHHTAARPSILSTLIRHQDLATTFTHDNQP